MTLWIYDGAFGQPHKAVPFEDTDDEWHDALSDSQLQVVDKEGKVYSPAVCGAEFAPGAESKQQAEGNLLAVHALVLDVDNWAEHEPFTEEELREILAGYRFIAWTTWSSTLDCPKWRVVIPLASPMPPTKHQALWRILNEVLEGTMVEASVSDPGRLGFFGSVASESGRQAYTYFIAAGERLDWSLLDLEDSQLSLPRALTPADLSRSPDWSTEAQALSSAKRYYGKVGSDVDVGGRHELLLRASCKLWWDYALEDENHVFEVLSLINANFPEPKTEDEVWAEVVAGNDRTLGANRVDQPTMYGYEREPIARATKTSIKELARSLKKQTREEAKSTGRALEAIAAGHAICEPVEAKPLVLRAATELAAHYPREKPERLLDLMQMSLQAQRAKSTTHPVPTDEEVLSKLRWKQNEMRRRSEDLERDRADAQKRDIVAAFSGKRDTPYTSREYREWEQQGHADNKWVLQRDRDFYFFVNGEYEGPYGERAANNFVHVKLAPAAERVRTTFVDEKGKPKQRQLDDIVREYGTLIDKVEFCLFASKSQHFDDERKLVMPALRQRDIEPEFVPEVDTWLRLLAGPHYEKLETWLAAFGSFDRELSVLFMVTEANQGKKLLADGLCRIYQTSGARSLEKALLNAGELLASPVLLLDERLPFFWRNDASARLRELLSESSRSVADRGRSGPSLTGFLRVMAMGNNPGFLWDNSDTSSTEEEATRHRLLTIDTRGNKDAGAYLESLGSRHRHFVTKDLIAKHVLYLQSTVSIPVERFVVHDGERVDEFGLRGRYMRNDAIDEVGFWFYRVFSEKKIPGNAMWGLGEALMVSASELVKVWDQFSVDKRSINVKKLSMFLDAFCLPTSAQYTVDVKGGSARVRLREFSLPAFEQWLTERGLDPGDVEEGIVEVATRRRVKTEARKRGWKTEAAA